MVREEEEEEGAAGLGRPQFGISSLFVIHTEKNESRCRSGGEGGGGRGRGDHQRRVSRADDPAGTNPSQCW